MSKQSLIDSIRRLTDSVQEGKETAVEVHSRRVWMKNFAAVSATSGVLWACGSKGGDDATAAAYSADDAKADATTMNVALGLEQEAIAIYTAAAGLSAVWSTDASALAPALLAVAKTFLGHHTAHAAALTEQINKLKDQTMIDPVAAKTTEVYLAPYPGIATLTGKAGLLTVLQVAAEREMNAANAYFGAISGFKNAELKVTLGALTGDESAHYGVLNAAAFAHAALTSQDSGITADNIVSGALPPFTYSKSGLRAS